MKHTLRRLLKGLGCSEFFQIDDRVRRSLLLAGVNASWALRKVDTVEHLSEVEFRVFSQFGDDGIIEWLVQRIPDLPRTFIEFGVENYREANTRFLLEHRNWRGLILDGSDANMKVVRRDAVMWRSQLTARTAFVTCENINALIADAGFSGEIGILSIDIDGVDYWVWDAIDVVQPVIVICEYNAVLGDLQKLTVPYRPDFVRHRAHSCSLYWGASIAALTDLAGKRGYGLIGTNGAGNNAYFVRADKLDPFLARIADRSGRPSYFRESKDAAGRFSFVSGTARADLIADMPVVRVDSKETVSLRDAGPLYSPRWQSLMD